MSVNKDYQKNYFQQNRQKIMVKRAERKRCLEADEIERLRAKSRTRRADRNAATRVLITLTKQLLETLDNAPRLRNENMEDASP
jgi:hypothetical protein